MATARETAIAEERKDICHPAWLSTPALVIIFCAALGPLLVVLFYSFLTKGDYGGVKWIFSTDGWFSVFFERDIFDDTVTFADAHLSIFWRSVKLSLATTVLALSVWLSDRLFHRHATQNAAGISGCSCVTIPFWTNLLIRTFAMRK